MKNYQEISSKPIFFEKNRVFRVYTGGKLFGDFFGDSSVDNNYPEEWVASSVKALNEGSQTNEGISKVEGTEIYLDDLIEQERANILGERKDLGVLVKILDSAIRLPMQAHPDKAFSRKYFNSEYGKAECWIILATRENAKIYFGFKDRISQEDFKQYIERSETERDVLTSLVNEIEAKPGDIYFIPAKMVHAIGYGCLILEVQEPTDFTIQPEYWCADYHLSPYQMYLGIDENDALDCFDFSVFGESVVQLGKKEPVVVKVNQNFKIEALITYEDTPCFSINRYWVKETKLTLKNAPAIYIVTKGRGKVIGEGYQKDIQKGSYFMLPYCAKEQFYVTSDSEIEFVECLPSM